MGKIAVSTVRFISPGQQQQQQQNSVNNNNKILNLEKNIDRKHIDCEWKLKKLKTAKTEKEAKFTNNKILN